MCYSVKALDPDNGSMVYYRKCMSQEEANDTVVRLLEGDKELTEEDIEINSCASITDGCDCNGRNG